MNAYSPIMAGAFPLGMNPSMNQGINVNSNVQPDSFRSVYGILGRI